MLESRHKHAFQLWYIALQACKDNKRDLVRPPNPFIPNTLAHLAYCRRSRRKPMGDLQIG
jgi:hypothetical protein